MAQNKESRSEARGQLYSVTQLGLDLGVSARTIRLYEDKGLISPRRAGNNRVYTQRDKARMILILRGKKLGFTLREIKESGPLRCRPHPCEAAAAAAAIGGEPHSAPRRPTSRPQPGAGGAARCREAGRGGARGPRERPAGHGARRVETNESTYDHRAANGADAIGVTA